MMKGNKIPDAWDDDWEAQVAKEDEASESTDKPQETTSMTRSERLAKHAEAQRTLWEAAYVKIVA
jgi:hypothetical protein